MIGLTKGITCALLPFVLIVPPAFSNNADSYFPPSLAERLTRNGDQPNCFLPLDLVQNAKVHVIYLENPHMPTSRVVDDLRWSDIEVHVEQSAQPSVLLLMSDDPVNWKITAEEDTNLIGVHVSSNTLVEISEFPKDLPLTAMLGNIAGVYCDYPPQLASLKLEAEEFEKAVGSMSLLHGSERVRHLYLYWLGKAARELGLGQIASYQVVKTPKVIVSEVAELEFQARVSSGQERLNTLKFELPETGEVPKKRLIISKERANAPKLKEWIVSQGYGVWLDQSVGLTLCEFDTAFAEATGMNRLRGDMCRYGIFWSDAGPRIFMLTGVIEAHEDAFFALQSSFIVKTGIPRFYLPDTSLTIDVIDLDVLDLPTPQ